MFDDKERSRNAGFSAHMTKPIDPRALLELIDQL
jgi:CheY-like chemotaxis protein